MNLQEGSYVFYVDIYFIQNFIVKFVVIYLALYWHRVEHVVSVKRGWFRLVMSSAMGTMTEIVGLLFGGGWYLCFAYIIEALLIRKMIFPKGMFLRLMITVIGLILLVNGILEVFWNRFGRDKGYFLLLIGASTVSGISIRMIRNYKQITKGIYGVKMCHGNQTIVTKGYYDSGNQLRDPYTGKYVHVVSQELIGKLKIDMEKELYIPYQALGNTNGLIRIYYLDYLKIYQEKSDGVGACGIGKEEWKIPIAVEQESLFQGKKYQVILNGNCL